MRVNVCSRSLAALVFLAIVAVSHAVVFWVPVWKQTTVLRYHPKKGWYPVKHGGTGSTFLKPKKLPPLAHIIKKAQQHYKAAISHHPLSQPVKAAPIQLPISQANILHHPKYRGWKRPKPIHKQIIHHPPPPPPPCLSCHGHGPSSWKPSKPFKGKEPHSHRRPSKLKLKRRPIKPVPSFNLDFPNPFHQGPFQQHDFLPKPNRPRPHRTRQSPGKFISKYNPFHKIITSHFAPGSPKDAKKGKNKPFSKLNSHNQNNSHKQFFSSKIKRPIPVKQVLSRPKKLPKLKINTHFRGFDFPRLRGKLKTPREPKGKDFLTHNDPGSYNFNNFPKLNHPPSAPQVQTYFSSFGDGLNDVFKIDNSPKGPFGGDFLTNHGDGGFSFQTFPQMNSPPSVTVPQLDSNFFDSNFGNLRDVSESPEPYSSPRVPRGKSRFPLFSFSKANQYNKINDHPKSHPRQIPPTTDDDFFQHYEPNDQSSSKENFDSVEEHPKPSHLQNTGVHHSPAKEFSDFGGFQSGFGRTSGFSNGQRGQGWGDWVW